MIILPAIDLIGGRAVRLERGDYAKMTVYSENVPAVARDFEQAGAEYVHMVDLEGARDGGTPNFASVQTVLRETKLRVEIGGGIRDEAAALRYLDAGAARVVLGTAAVEDEAFLRRMVLRCGARIAVGVDLRDGLVSVRGWKAESGLTGADFCQKLADLGVQTVICTDISRDGMLGGTNLPLYRGLTARFPMDFIASGGVSSLEDVRALRALGLAGAIVGKAYYTGALRLSDALEAAR